MSFVKDNIPKELFERLHENQIAFFVGAGLSIDAGFPNWKGLVEELIDKGVQTKRINGEKEKQYRSLLDDSSKFLMLAEELKWELGSVYNRYMEQRFQESDLKPTHSHELLARIKCSLIMTTNYDNLIEKGFNKVYGEYPNTFSYSQSREAANNFWKNKFFVFKAHGDAKQDIDSLILSQKDYRRVLYREAGYRSLLQSIFTVKAIIFIGVSLTDPEFNQLLDFLHDSYHGGGPTHYLITATQQSIDILTRRYLDDFGIQTIIYENNKGHHEELAEFLQILSEDYPR